MLPELTTERLLLQQVQPEDQQFIFESLSRPDVISFLAFVMTRLKPPKDKWIGMQKRMKKAPVVPGKLLRNHLETRPA